MPLDAHLIDLNENFIDILYSLVKNTLSDGKKAIVLFPNVRPIRFLLKKLTPLETLQVETYTLDQFFEKIVLEYYPTPLNIQSAAERYLLLFDIMKNFGDLYDHLGKSDEKVIPWAKRLSILFDEIDKQMLESALQNFAYVEAIPEVTKILENLKTLYQIYRQHFETLTYRGDTYLKATKIIDKDEIRSFLQNKTLFICGLVYLSKSEISIINTLSSFADVKYLLHTDLFDRDKFDIDGKIYSFDTFNVITNTLQKLKITDPTLHKINGSYPHIELYEVSDSLAEANLAKSFLTEYLAKNSRAYASIILPNQKSLLPLLSFIDQNANINVTMGYPLVYTDFYLFLKHLLELLNVLYINKINNNSLIVETEAILKLLDLSILKSLKQSYFNVSEVRQHLFEMNLPYVEFDKLPNADRFTKLLDTYSFRDFASWFEEFFDNLTISELDPFTIYTFKLFTKEVLLPLKSLSQNYSAVSISFISYFLNELIKDMIIPFEGNPLKNTQIMGLLESRFLNFDFLLMLDINEGIIPSDNKVDPLLPETLKKQMGLSSYKEREELMKYYFFRTIFSSKEVILLYLSGSNSTEKFVKSRFIEQLILMIELKNQCATSPHKLPFIINLPKAEESGIKKDTDAEDYFNKFQYRCCSPSELDAYVRCPYLHYLRYIKQIDEKISFDKRFEADKIGSIVHIILESLFKKQKNNILDVTHILQAKQDVQDIIKRLPESILKGINAKDAPKLTNFFNKLDTFYLNILKTTLIYRMSGYLNALEKQIEKNKQIVILELEKYIEDHTVKIHGYIDRIDKEIDGDNTTLKIIDYKTGKFTKNPTSKKLLELPLDNFQQSFGLNEIKSIKEHVTSLQLPAYLLAVVNQYNKDNFTEYVGQIHYIANSNNPIGSSFKLPPGSELFNKYCEVISYIRDHMINADRIYPLPDENCKYCEFAYFCEYGG